jgi:predicted DNA-binding protein (MmcQ/YjbR family)
MRRVGEAFNDNRMLESIYEYCRAKACVSEGFPFDEDTLVFKVAGKIFALLSLERTPLQINLKCEPARAIELRERYESVVPGYHMNKKHWNTIVLDSNLPTPLIFELIDHSYDRVVSGLPKAEKEALSGA